MAVMNGKRSMIPIDLTDAQLDALQGTLETVDDPEYRARVGDTLWLRRRDVKAARIAVESYLESGKRLENPEHWVPCMERYERAVRLARQIDKGELPKIVLAHLESRVKHYDGDDPSYFTLKAIELLVEFQFGDFQSISKIAGKVAATSRTDRNYQRARSYYDVQAKLSRLAKDMEGAEASRVASAECNFEEAEAREAGGSFMAARKFWEDAIKTFRERPTLRARIPELQKRLAIAGKKLLDEMEPIGHEIPTKEMAVQTEASFRGQLLDDALCRFALFNSPIDPLKLRKDTEESLKETPIHAFFDAEVFDEGGRKIARRPSIVSADEKDREAAIEGFMDQNARFYRSITVSGCLAPAMQTILSEHEITEPEIERIFKDSSFIPADRLTLFVRAILEGFRWDFSTSLHIFVPQVENALRFLLEQNGVVPRNVDNNGIEDVWYLDRILNHQMTKSVLGDPHVYELQSLLTGRIGPNIRNSLAHGLLHPGALNGDSAFYLWWLFFRLTLFSTPTLQAYIERKKLGN